MIFYSDTELNILEFIKYFFSVKTIAIDKKEKQFLVILLKELEW